VINFSLLHIIDYLSALLFQSSLDYPIKISERLELISTYSTYIHFYNLTVV